MRTVFRSAVVLALVPVVYMASVTIDLPLVVWHRFHPPGESALMRIRARQAHEEDREWAPRHEWVPLERISPHLGRAVVVAEDSRFHDHAGFDWEQIRRAWEDGRRGGATRGASTITQQTVKNLYLTPSRHVLRKGREAVLTAWMEVWLPKDRILELYLNVVEFGPGVFGAEAASKRYFGRPASDLTRGQAALLAATLPAPLLRNPGTPTPGLARRQRMILGRMARWYGEQAPPGAGGPVRRPSEPIPLDGGTGAAVDSAGP